jgi:hypothetical protein
MVICFFKGWARYHIDSSQSIKYIDGNDVWLRWWKIDAASSKLLSAAGASRCDQNLLLLAREVLTIMYPDTFLTGFTPLFQNDECW